MAEDSTTKTPSSSTSRTRTRASSTTKTPKTSTPSVVPEAVESVPVPRQTSSVTPEAVVSAEPTTPAPAPKRSQTRKPATSPPKITKTWEEKLADKSRKIDKLLISSALGFGRLSSGTILDIKKRVGNKGPSAVLRMHFLGSVRQRKKLAVMIESILDA